MPAEIWKIIPNFNKYEVSDQGNVRRIHYQKLSMQDVLDIRTKFNLSDKTQTDKQLLMKQYNITISNLNLILNNKTWVDLETPHLPLKPWLNKDGYYMVTLTGEKERKHFQIHRLVYQTFITEIPIDKVVDHINEIKTDNSLSNLQLLSNRDNNIKNLKMTGKLGKKRRSKYVPEPHGLTSEIEEWKVVNGFENYMISNRGQIKRLYKEGDKIVREKMVNPYKTKDGYLRTTLFNNKKQKVIYIHKLVIENFLYPRPNKKLVINHINNIPDDNNIENLEYITAKMNTVHAFKYHANTEWSVNKLLPADISIIRKLFHNEKMLIKDIADLYKVSFATISKIINKHTWTYIQD